MRVYVIDPRSCQTLRALDAQSWDLCPDALDTESSAITVSGKVRADYAKKMLLVSGRLYLIKAVTPEKNGSAKLTLGPADGLFERQLIYDTPETTPQTIGEYLADTITAEWIEQSDTVYALPNLTVSSSDSAEFVPPEADEESGIYDFLDYVRTVRREYGVTMSIQLTATGIEAEIRQASPQEHTLVHGDSSTTVEMLTWAGDGVAKITSIQQVDTGEIDEEEQKIYRTEIRDWYLSADGTTSETPPQTRAEGSWELLSVSEKDDAEEKVTERFRQSRSGEHKIELFSDEVMAVGDTFTLRYDGAVYVGTVASIRRKSGESRPHYRSGDFATTLTDKIRSIQKGVKT